MEESSVDWKGVDKLKLQCPLACTACGNVVWTDAKMSPVGWVRHLNVWLCPFCATAIGKKRGKVSRDFVLSCVNKIDEMENDAIEQLKTAASERDKLRMYLEGHDD